MHGYRMRFSFQGDVQLDRTLVRFGERVQDARPAWEKIADRFEQNNARQFASEGRHSSGGWSPLSPRYAAWKAQHYPGAPILVRDGDLQASLTGRPFGVEVIELRRMAIGSDVPHGAYHQKGDGVPRRRPVELTEADRREWVQILQRHITENERD